MLVSVSVTVHLVGMVFHANDHATIWMKNVAGDSKE